MGGRNDRYFRPLVSVFLFLGEIPVPGQAALLVALHWNRLAAKPERFEQRFKGSDHRHGRRATPDRFVANSDAHQKVAALSQDRISCA